MNTSSTPTNAFEELRDAISHNDTTTITKALHNGFHVDSQDSAGRTLLHFAAASNNSAIVQILLTNGATIDLPDSRHQTPLYWAAIRGAMETMSMLIESDACVNHIDSRGNTPLIATARSDLCPLDNKARAVELLLRAGALPTTKNKFGASAESAASNRGYENVVHILKMHNNASPYTNR